MATRLQTNGSEFQVNLDLGLGQGLLGDQATPDATALTDGRFVIGYLSAFNGNNSDKDPIIRILGGVNFLDTYFAGSQQTDPALAPRTDGGLGVVFSNDLHADTTVDANGQNITYRPVTATGVLGLPLAVGDFNDGGGHDSLVNPDIATLSTGRQVVVFERIFTFSIDDDIYLNVVDAAGTATQFSATSALAVQNNGSWQSNPAVAASGNEALVVFEDATGTTHGSANISARLFNGGSNTLGAAFTIADHTGFLFNPEVAALPDNRYVIVYGDSNDLWGRIWDPMTAGGAFLSDEFLIDKAGGNALNPSVAATADGGFIVTWNEFMGGGSDYDIFAHRFDAHGQSYGDIFAVNTLTNLSQFDPTIAVSGANVLIAWQDSGTRPGDTTPTGIRGQLFTTTVFDYDSARIGDLDGNGRADILFQNDTGEVAVWQTNGAGAVSAITSLGPRPAGFLIDGTGNFNSTPGDDILLRSSGGTIAIWPTSGIAAGAPVVIGGTPLAYHIAGVGDCTGDGQEDILFRSDAGQIVTWGIVNNALALAPQILGSTAATFHIAGIDDFTGDHQSDILFRNDDGTIAVWQVANNQLLSAKAVGSTSTAYHVVSTGDFDGNGAKDILFRGDNGELVEWLLDSTGSLLMSPTSVGIAPAQYHVDGTGDLNGDGRDDIILRHADGTLVDWLMNGATLAAPPAVLAHASVDYAIAEHHFDVV